jgi:di/tricarboxylate transporter
MVFGPGRYRFLDVTRYGLGLTLIMTALIPCADPLALRLILTNTGRTEA